MRRSRLAVAGSTGPRGRARRGDRVAHPDGLLVIRDYPDRTNALVIGVMTGTSADAVDTALVRFEGAGPDARPRLIAYRGADTTAYYRTHPAEQTMIRQFETAYFTPSHPAWAEMEAAIEDEVEQALLDRKTTAEAIADAQQRLAELVGKR